MGRRFHAHALYTTGCRVDALRRFVRHLSCSSSSRESFNLRMQRRIDARRQRLTLRARRSTKRVARNVLTSMTSQLPYPGQPGTLRQNQADRRREARKDHGTLRRAIIRSPTRVSDKRRLHRLDASRNIWSDRRVSNLLPRAAFGGLWRVTSAVLSPDVVRGIKYSAFRPSNNV